MSTQQFFGGLGTDLGTVAPLPAPNWRDFVQAILGHPVVIPATRESFFAMDKTARDKIKRVRYVTPAVFKEKGQRVTSRAIGFSLVALDIDDSEQAKPIFRDVQALRDSLKPFGFAVYATASSTPTAPRLRVFVRVDGVMASSLYARAINTVAAKLGLPTVTKESYVMVQPMFLPSMFREEDTAIDHPLLASDTEGRGLTPSDLVAGEEHTTPTSQKHGDVGDADADELDYLRPTVEGITVEDAKEALGHLDPDMKMAEWIETGAALKHQFNEAGFELWNEWSKTGTKYPGEDDAKYRWDSLKANPRGRAPVTIRSLFFRAQEAGWDGAAVGTRCYEAILRWMSISSADELMAQGAKRIAAAPMLSPLEQGALINDLQLALKRVGKKVSRSDLQSELKRIARSAKPVKTNKQTEDNELPPWARGICYVMGTDEFYAYAATRKMSAKVLNAAYSKNLMTPDAMETGKPPILPEHFLLNIHCIPRVDHYRYDPSHPEEVFFQEGKHRFINTYVADYPEPNLERAEEAGKIFWDHLCLIAGSENYARTIADFLAYQVQVPGGKIRWAVLIQGAEGAGKGYFSDVMSAVLGENNVKMVNGSSLVGRQYNEWAQGAQIVCIDEVRVAGQNRFEVMNKLKPLITNSKVPIDEKYEGLVTVPNCSNYLLFTNHRDALALTEGDRRYFVIHSPIQTKAQIKAIGGPEYFSMLFGALKENASGLRAWFEQWKISPDFLPDGEAPETEHRAELIEATESALMQAVREALKNSTNPLLQTDLLSVLMLRHQIELDGVMPHGTTMAGIACVLRDMGYVSSNQRLTIGGEHHQFWQPIHRPHGDDLEAVAASRLPGGELV